MENAHVAERPTGLPAEEKPVAKAVRASASLDMVSVRFQSFSANAFRSALELPDHFALQPKIGFTRPVVRHSGLHVSIATTVVFSADAELPEEGRTPVASIRASIEILYQKKQDVQDIAEADLQEFANINAPFHAWGYWREFVQSSLARLNLPSYSLPMFRVTDVPKLMIEGDEEHVD